MLNDYGLALLCQQQYDGQIPLHTVANVAYSRIDDSKEGITLIFRGTSDLEDAKRDLEALMTPSPYGRVHAGARMGLPDVLNTENISNDGTPILCIGHSLGAMRAQMAYRELKWRGYPTRNLKCVTFECPRIGDSDATRYGQQDVENRTYQNYKNLFEHDAFTIIPVWLIGEPYVDMPNCHQFWAAPTSSNEWNGAPQNIQAHSLSNCVIPYLKTIFQCASV